MNILLGRSLSTGIDHAGDRAYFRETTPHTAAFLVFALAAATSAASSADDLAPGDLFPYGNTIDAEYGPGACTSGNSNCNFMLEPGEVVRIWPSWRNFTQSQISASAFVSHFEGPGGPGLYTIVDSTATYTIPGGLMARTCSSPPCYVIGLGNPPVRPARHWDVTVGETLSTGHATTWTLHVGRSYPDVSSTSPFYRSIESLLHNDIEFGCPTTGQFCPAVAMTRATMAAVVLQAQEGRFFVPPACQVGAERFSDVPAADPSCRWIEELARRGVVAGCGGGLYCPAAPVTREQMAVFMLLTREGPGYSPPYCTPGAETFADMPASSPFCRWVEDLVRRAVTAGCGNGNYCPFASVPREQMAVFVVWTFALDHALSYRNNFYLVNTADDVDDGLCSPSHCSLREAILAANFTSNPWPFRDEIRFRIPGTGVRTIGPSAALPPVIDPVVIDGYSQPGASPNTLPFGDGLNSTPVIALDLSGSGAIDVSGPSSLLRGLVIGASPSMGVSLAGGSAVEGCHIGTNADGTAPWPNSAGGILVPENQVGARVGGTSPAQRNLISGNGGVGVSIDTADETLVQGNLIGTDRAGMAAVANAGGGVSVFAFNHLSRATANVIGGLELEAGNVISGNGGPGVETSGLVGASLAIVENTRIQANLIGFVAIGGGALLNPTGIRIFQSGSWDTQIGGLSAGAPAGNAITASGTGIALESGINGGPYRTHIQGNAIRGCSVGIGGSPNPGGDATANVIMWNGFAGILLDGGQLRFSANSITGNNGLAIDLAPAGVDPNDPGDGDTGPNGRQNYPVLTSARAIGGSTTVTGAFNSRPSQSFVIELFASPSAGPSGLGEGVTFIGQLTVVTDAAGNAPVSVVLPVGVPPGQVITATATDGQGNTSEFSNAVVVTN